MGGHIQNMSVHNMLRQLSDELGLKMQGVKGISCECGEACVGQTGHHCVKTART